MATMARTASGSATMRAAARAGSVTARRLRRAVLAAAITLPLAGILALLARGTGYAYRPAVGAAAATAPGFDVPADTKARKQLETRLRQRQRQLLAALERQAPKGIYLVIDQTQNRLYVMKDDQVLREAVCSAGSGMILLEGEGGRNRKWVFDTPRGVFKVLQRNENPVWKKPDWAFVEEGLPIPRNDSERFDYGVLGEYALHFGNGYMIHGTLYERLLGRSVTHGCIRLGREDLREVWRVTDYGTPIYIY
jgi:L,D-transpeptidase YbiS